MNWFASAKQEISRSKATIKLMLSILAPICVYKYQAKSNWDNEETPISGPSCVLLTEINHPVHNTLYTYKRMYQIKFDETFETWYLLLWHLTTRSNNDIDNSGLQENNLNFRLIPGHSSFS